MIVGIPSQAHQIRRVAVRRQPSIVNKRQPGRPRVNSSRALPILFVALSLVAAPSSSTDPDLPIVTDLEASAAVSVESDPRCPEPPDRMPQVKVSWAIDTAGTPKSGRILDLLEATEYRVDLSMYRDGFETERFESHRPTPEVKRAGGSPEMSSARNPSFVVSNLRPGVYYTARVLIATPGGWIASDSTRFLTPICPVDGID